MLLHLCCNAALLCRVSTSFPSSHWLVDGAWFGREGFMGYQWGESNNQMIASVSARARGCALRINPKPSTESFSKTVCSLKKKIVTVLSQESRKFCLSEHKHQLTTVDNVSTDGLTYILEAPNWILMTSERHKETIITFLSLFYFSDYALSFLFWRHLLVKQIHVRVLLLYSYWSPNGLHLISKGTLQRLNPNIPGPEQV